MAWPTDRVPRLRHYGENTKRLKMLVERERVSSRMILSDPRQPNSPHSARVESPAAAGFHLVPSLLQRPVERRLGACPLALGLHPSAMPSRVSLAV